MIQELLRSFRSVHFMKFVIVGTLAFLVDWAVLAAFTHFLPWPFIGRLVSFSVATVFAWYFNATHTFNDVKQARKLVTFGRYIVTNSLGFIVNLVVYAGVLTFTAHVQDGYLIPLAAGCLSGLVINFLCSKFIVFRPKGSPIKVE